MYKKDNNLISFENGEWIYVKEKEEDNWGKRQFVSMDETGKLYGCVNIWNGKIVFWEIAKKFK